MFNFITNSDWMIEILSSYKEYSKKRLKDSKHLADISIALSHFVFRNGPVEDMHADGKLSDDDMMILNKYMVNAFAIIIDKLHNEEFDELEIFFLITSGLFGTTWDEPEFDRIPADEFKATQNIFNTLKTSLNNIGEV